MYTILESNTLNSGIYEYPMTSRHASFWIDLNNVSLVRHPHPVPALVTSHMASTSRWGKAISHPKQISIDDSEKGCTYKDSTSFTHLCSKFTSKDCNVHQGCANLCLPCCKFVNMDYSPASMI